MHRIPFCLALVVALSPLGAHAQSRSISNSAKVANAGTGINIPIINLPPPTGDPFANSALKEVADAQPPIIITTSIGSGTLNSSNILFTTPSPGLNGAF